MKKTGREVAYIRLLFDILENNCKKKHRERKQKQKKKKRGREK